MTNFVFLFPDDGEATLEAVLRKTKTAAIVSSPMNEKLLIFASEADAVFVRCGLNLRPASKSTLLVPARDQRTVTSWLITNGLARCFAWRTLEHLEFLTPAAEDSMIEAFSDLIGDDPYALPLNLWPDVFRPNPVPPASAPNLPGGSPAPI